MALEEGMRRRRRLDVSPTFNCRPRPKQNIIENGETLDTYHYTFQATATEKKHRRHNCKSKLFSGKMPPKCHQNKLEVFNTKEYPDLELTELELNLIAKKILFMKIHNKKF